MIDDRKLIIILTGAGISAESGLATFRDNNGLWNNCSVEEVASIEGFRRNPERVRGFYNELKEISKIAKPNRAHFAIVKLQEKFRVVVITQNIDALHEKAGTEEVYHIHGRLDQVICLKCGNMVTTDAPVTGETKCLICDSFNSFKPNIVFFGENLQCLKESLFMIRRADCFLSIGSSGVVYPAAGFVDLVPEGVDKIEFNLEPGANTGKFNKHYFGKAGKLLPIWVEKALLGEW